MPGAASGETAGRAPGDGPSVRLSVAVLAVLGTVVLALLAVWGSTALLAQRLPTGPALDPPAGDRAVARLTVKGREVALEEFRMTLAGPPFACSEAASPPAAAFVSFASCSHTVHPDFDATGDDWVATTGAALLDDAVVKPGLGDTAEATFRALFAIGFTAKDRAKIVPDPAPLQLALPADRYGTYSARVEVRRQGLATPYDRVVVVVLRLTSGRHVAVFSDFPHDAGKDALTSVVSSISSISLNG